jgi:hypothetical protein
MSPAANAMKRPQARVTGSGQAWVPRRRRKIGIIGVSRAYVALMGTLPQTRTCRQSIPSSAQSSFAAPKTRNVPAPTGVILTESKFSKWRDLNGKQVWH